MIEKINNFLNNIKDRIKKKEIKYNYRLKEISLDFRVNNSPIGYSFDYGHRNKRRVPEWERKLSLKYEDRKRRTRIYGSPVTTGIVLKKIMFLYEFLIVRYITARCLFDKTPWDINKLNYNSILYIRFNNIILRMYTQIFLLRQTYQRVRVGLNYNNFLLYVTEYMENEFNMLKAVDGLKELFITQMGWVNGLLSNLKFITLFFEYMEEHPEQINKDREFIKKVRTVTELYKIPLVIVIMSKNYEGSFKETIIIRSDAVLITNASFDYKNLITYSIVGNINSMSSTFYYIELYKIAAKLGLEGDNFFFINVFFNINLSLNKGINKLRNKLKYGWRSYLRAQSRWKKLNPDVAKVYSNRYFISQD